MILKVANDDVISFKNNNEWLKIHPKEALIFKEPIDTWNRIKNSYTNSFSKIVYGKLPNENEVMNTIIGVGKRLKDLKWDIYI